MNFARRDPGQGMNAEAIPAPGLADRDSGQDPGVRHRSPTKRQIDRAYFGTAIPAIVPPAQHQRLEIEARDGCHPMPAVFECRPSGAALKRFGRGQSDAMVAEHIKGSSRPQQGGH